jgi:Fatty acid hydroxylase
VCFSRGVCCSVSVLTTIMRTVGSCGGVHPVDFKAPIATASEYAHPLEFAFSNVIPIMVGVLCSGCHLVIIWFWVAVAIMNTLTGHSGYCFPWSPFGDARLHDYHHESFRDNYGALGILVCQAGGDAVWRGGDGDGDGVYAWR